MTGGRGFAGTSSPRSTPAAALSRKRARESRHRLQVRVDALAHDLPLGDVRQHADATERLARVNVRQVHFISADLHRLDGVAQRVRVVRQSAGVEDQPLHPAPLGVELVDQRPLVIALKNSKLEPQLARPGAQPRVELGELRRAVDLRLALAQKVQVGPVQDEHLHRGVSENSSSARSTPSASISSEMAGTTCALPMPASTTNLNAPPSAFLSLRAAAITASRAGGETGGGAGNR